MWQALTGSWEWDKVMSHLNMWDMDETDIVDFFAGKFITLGLGAVYLYLSCFVH